MTRRRLEEFDAKPHPAVSFDAYAEVGRARLLIADGHLEAGRDHLRSSAATYREQGRWSSELLCSYELVRLGYADEVVARMDELAAIAQGGMFAAWVDHARHATSGDVVALGGVVERLASMGYAAFAMDAALQAAEAARRQGLQREATGFARRATELRAVCEVPGSPLDEVELGPVPLTRRERDVAMLAAQGLASKAIAERLFISPRTADNHLARVYDKLGIRTRAELLKRLDAGAVSLVA